jgi:hypothetical protein
MRPSVRTHSLKNETAGPRILHPICWPRSASLRRLGSVKLRRSRRHSLASLRGLCRARNQSCCKELCHEGALPAEAYRPHTSRWAGRNGDSILFGIHSASPSTTGTRFAVRKSTNTLSLGEICRLDGHSTRRGPECPHVKPDQHPLPGPLPRSR